MTIFKSGGRAIFQIGCGADGLRTYSQRIEHVRPSPVTLIGIYATLDGTPVADFRIGGIGQGFEPQPPEGSFPVFVGSDSRGCFGHQCPRCNGYFRNRIHPKIYPLTCAYCGLRGDAFRFLTPGQKAYIRHYVETLLEGLREIEPGTEREIVIDMDAIADQGNDQPRPAFYYADEVQQTNYRCEHCNEFNDIRGKYGYCASCGWRNNAQSLRATFATLRQRLNSGEVNPADTVKSAVSEFDASCRDIANQVIKRIPMKPARKADLERLIFHDIESAAIADMKNLFDIDLLRGMDGDFAFLKLMIHRRHVFEHNAGVADERYVRESGDSDAREGVLIRETQENAHRLIGGLARMVGNFDKDFHEIFPPTQLPIDYYQRERSGRRS